MDFRSRNIEETSEIKYPDITIIYREKTWCCARLGEAIKAEVHIARAPAQDEGLIKGVKR